MLLNVAVSIIMVGTMQSLDDNERREVLGGVLADELKVILEYVKDIPLIKQDTREIKKRLTSVERIENAHEFDIKQIRQHLRTA